MVKQMIKIRNNIFETNSSSTHSITMCMSDDFEKWVKGEFAYVRWEQRFCPIEEAVNEIIDKLDEAKADEEIKSHLCLYSDRKFWSYDDWLEDKWYEKYEEIFTTPSGENVVAFGYYGHS